MKYLPLHIFLIVLVCAAPLRADAPADSATSYQWIRSLYDQNDPNLSSEILTLVHYYVVHFPESTRNSELLQLQGNLYVKEKKYLNAFASYLKQITVYPDSNRDYNSINALLLLSLKSKKLSPKRSIVRYWLTSNSLPHSLKKNYLAYVQRLFVLDLPQTDEIALREIDWLLKKGFLKSNLDELLYEKAQILSRNKKQEKAFYTYLELMKEWPNSAYFPNALYYIADYYQNTLKKNKTALKLFVHFVRKYPDHSLAALAHLHLAHIYESAYHRPRLAVREYVAFINRSNDDRLIARAYYQMATIYERELDNRTVAIVLYAKILHYYPDSKVAPKAKAALNYLLKQE
ncbi:MAG: tetratricopeptide repeat protein [Calditrichaeota bacterium]|nr:tetratricopeptide repeat protein [Calditrichota bacterium]